MADIEIARINGLAEFALILDKVLDKHEEFNSRFPTDMSKLDMASQLIHTLGNKSWCWGECYPNGDLKFFGMVEALDEKRCYWHLLYSHPDYRKQTIRTLEAIKQFLRDEGYEEILFITRRLSPSYKRFMGKLNAFQYEIKYKCKL